ncbi:hypothetical protein [Pseudonocardia humida]|uniref:Secreted protein n=1 Tax=Pseudonocardia humida TaxID=2800819 RepID=A0ABT1A3D5_9PSEU|nr:hypothetical protein [Pseudonocardia humida]MCO1657503.1 hypothetical protein [Pseudonocardia humida]
MRTAVRLAGFAAGLALVFAAAWATGANVGPPPSTTAAPASAMAHDDAGGEAAGAGHGHEDGAGSEVESAGLTATAAGYTLVPQVTTFLPGAPAEFGFAITGSDGRPVTAFDVEHERQLHLIVVRRDTAGFQHLHPVLGPDGVWRVPLVLPAGGVYRAYADFVPTGGPHLVLGADLYAAGDFTPLPTAPSRVAQVDGYQVRLDGELVAGSPSQVFATITRDGAPVTDLEPYLGAFGHLVTLRRSDLVYLHVHPDGAAPAATDRAGPAIAFVADVPSSGEYRLYLDFQHAGAVHTAEFTVATRSGS